MALKTLYNPIMIVKYSGFLQDKPINDKIDVQPQLLETKLLFLY